MSKRLGTVTFENWHFIFFLRVITLALGNICLCPPTSVEGPFLQLLTFLFVSQPGFWLLMLTSDWPELSVVFLHSPTPTFSSFSCPTFSSVLWLILVWRKEYWGRVMFTLMISEYLPLWILCFTVFPRDSNSHQLLDLGGVSQPVPEAAIKWKLRGVRCFWP